MSLYNCRSTSTPDQYRITKFDADLNPEASYVVSRTQCQCPAYQRPSCRHRDMLPEFLRHGRMDTTWMLDWDLGRSAWRQYVGPLELPDEAAEVEPAIAQHIELDPNLTPQQIAEAFAEVQRGYIPFSEEGSASSGSAGAAAVSPDAQVAPASLSAAVGSAPAASAGAGLRTASSPAPVIFRRPLR